MNEYFKTDLGSLYHGDCLDVLKTMPENSIDNLVCDPPYGYAFMNKDWDKAFVSIDIWKECLRVLKPGSFAFIMSSPRQDCLSEMISRIRKAGFQTNFTSIYWTYSSGFPKAGNIGKMVDKKMGVKGEIVGKSVGKGYSSQQEKNKIEGYRPYKKGLPYEEADRNIYSLASKQAKALDGSYSGYQPKPAVEVIIVAMKPLSEKTYVEQALKNGKGITWLDNCRIPYESEGEFNKCDEKQKSFKDAKNIGTIQKGKTNFLNGDIKVKQPVASEFNQGRFPANLLVSDDCLNDGVIREKPHINNPEGMGQGIGGSFGGGLHNVGYTDSGSYSRYFDLDKWWIEKIKALPESVRKVFPFAIIPKASKGEKNKGCDSIDPKYMDTGRKVGSVGGTNPRNRGGETVRHNFHPTSKPVKLMAYLITLGSQSGDTILDPFLGSGTTCVASDMLGRKWIGIEKEKEYIEIAKHRIKDESSQIKMAM